MQSTIRFFSVNSLFKSASNFFNKFSIFSSYFPSIFLFLNFFFTFSIAFILLPIYIKKTYKIHSMPRCACMCLLLILFCSFSRSMSRRNVPACLFFPSFLVFVNKYSILHFFSFILLSFEKFSVLFFCDLTIFSTNELSGSERGRKKKPKKKKQFVCSWKFHLLHFGINEVEFCIKTGEK